MPSFRHGGRPIVGKRRTMASFGLRVPVCAACRGCCPVALGEPDPATCHHCGEPFRDAFAPAPEENPKGSEIPLAKPKG